MYVDDYDHDHDVEKEKGEVVSGSVWSMIVRCLYHSMFMCVIVRSIFPPTLGVVMGVGGSGSSSSKYICVFVIFG